eukprot:CAMPEP_0173377452 /NCGR_PEP_ID=MMETSP1356-20130122/670_1 /TAXON_ID=77927 ORGANISM="Hemiselmis virescens, Strain PCC157" /NCGR_SAMPLE_ID=MMETSP1356 /ASSEMBLY_ACC=CAM_ASM_000847 /LENGTH=68 /DNA_ID=CAMNT_0014330189 /DNA_START=24 /DNA_END=230 /DNA_ORIENTATION=+
MGFVSKSFASLGPMPVQVIVAMGMSVAFAQGMTSLYYKPPSKTASPEWRAAAKTLPAPLKDPQGLLNK